MNGTPLNFLLLMAAPFVVIALLGWIAVTIRRHRDRVWFRGTVSEETGRQRREEDVRALLSLVVVLAMGAVVAALIVIMWPHRGA